MITRLAFALLLPTLLALSCGGGSGGGTDGPPSAPGPSASPIGTTTPAPTPTPDDSIPPQRSGELDLRFGSAGMATLGSAHERSTASTILVDAAGRILVVGGAEGPSATAACLIARLASDGRPDASFGDAGRVEVDAATILAPCGTEACSASCEALALEPDADVLAAARIDTQSVVPSRRWALIRHSDAGAPDPADTDGIVVVADEDLARSDLVAAALDVQDGGLVVGGAIVRTGRDRPTEPAVRRYLADGARDGSFANGGTADFSPEASDLQIRHLALTVDRALLLAGHGTILSTYPVLGRLTAHGELDATFGDGGWASFPPTGGPHGVAGHPVPLPDGSVLALEDAPDHLQLVRFTPAGEVDPSFGDQGRVVVTGERPVETPLAAATAGHVVLAWQRQDDAIVVQRRDRNGAPDLSFGDAGTSIITPGGSGRFALVAMTVRGAGGVLLAGALEEPGRCPDCSVVAVARLVP
jgi:uncharacterized delta-60 repeat protein